MTVIEETTSSAEAILEKLSLDQKASLLSGSSLWRTQGIPEHNIPSILLSDGPNGVRGEQLFKMQPSACFPCGTGLGATFDKQLLYRAGSLMAKEAKAKRVHTILGPTINIQRSPIGGRGFESFSEDPIVSGMAAAAVINGIQDGGIQATIKHYVCNDQEDDRTAADCIVSQRALREIYLLPFQVATRLSNPGAFMSSYNKVNGEHVSESKFLLNDVLRKEWGWDGLVVSDWGGVYSTVASLEAGCDLEMPGPGTWRRNLITNSVTSKQLHPDVVDTSATRVLKFVEKAVAESGIGPNTEPFVNDNADTSKLLRQLAADSVTLLKNEGGILPLRKDKTVAIIGSNGFHPIYCGGGSASLLPYYSVSLFEGVSSKTTEKPSFAVGANAFKVAPTLGKHLTTSSGEKGWSLTVYDKPKSDPSRKKLDQRVCPDTRVIFADYIIPDFDSNIFYGDFEGFFVPAEDGTYQFEVIVIGTAKLFVDDKLVADNSINQKLGDTFFGFGTIPVKGTVDLYAGRRHKITVEYGCAATSKLGASFLKGCLQVGGMRVENFETSLAFAVETAKKADQVILAVGLNMAWETEGHDRYTMDLPPHVDDMVEEILKVNPNAVVVIQSGTPVTLPWIHRVKGAVQAWYGGNEVGNGIADVLFGDVNPSGKLPLSYPKRIEDNPAYLNSKSEKGKIFYGENVYVGYRYYEAKKLDVVFPFGHGLSYTKFEYKNLAVSLDLDIVTISLDVSNTGKVAGKETVQFYVAQDKPSVGRPVKELKEFSKVDLGAGETKNIFVQIPVKYATSFWDEFGDYWLSEKGKYHVFVAASSADIRLTGEFEVAKTVHWRGN